LTVRLSSEDRSEISDLLSRLGEKRLDIQTEIREQVLEFGGGVGIGLGELR
jgi:hypothetical protein